MSERFIDELKAGKAHPAQPSMMKYFGTELNKSRHELIMAAGGSTALMPAAPGRAARARTWMLAALNTVEPPILALNRLGMERAKSEGVAETREQVAGLVRQRLESVAHWLDGKEHLEGDFSAGDLLMTTVLRVLRDTDMVSSLPVLAAYQRRCEARPAFQAALAAQLATFAAHAPAELTAS